MGTNMKDDWHDNRAKSRGNSSSSKKRKRNKNQSRNEGSKSGYKDKGYMTSLETPNVITDSSKDNDPKWYMNLDPIAKDYASLPMSQVLGLAAPDVTRGIGTQYDNSKRFTSPGIMSIYFRPTIGMNNAGATAPVNIAAQELYTLTRRANSGAKNYDKTDLMMVILAMDSAYMLYEDMLRAYRVASTFTSVNRYYPNAVLNALGYQTSISNNLAQFRGLLDVFAYKLASVNIPDQLDLIKRHSWMCSNIYLDNDSNKAQSYAFVPRFIYRWTEGTDAEPTHLTPIALHDSTETASFLSIQQCMNMIDNIMNPILGSEDVGTITGDLMKAFGESGMIKIRPVEDYAALVPVYSAEVLMQIRNMFSSPNIITSAPGATGNIEQVLSDTVKGPYLRQNINVNVQKDGGRRVNTRPILNFIDEDASPENVLVATRLMSLCDAPGSGGATTLSIYGTEVVESMFLWTFNPDLGTLGGFTIDQDLYFGTTMSLTNIINNVWRIVYCSQFRNCPANYMYTESVNGTLPNYMGGTTDMNNYIYLDDTTLVHLHETATMSLFTVKDYKLSF